jgi:hypothetical protein
MLRRLVAIVALPFVVIAGVVLTAPAANATHDPQYPPAGASISVSAVRVSPGETVRVRACGYEPRTFVTLTVRRGARPLVATVRRAGADGCATFRVRLFRMGTHRLTTAGRADEGGRLVMSVRVKVVRRAAATSPASSAVTPAMTNLSATAPPAAASPVSLTGLSAGGGLLVGGLLVGSAMWRRRYLRTATAGRRASTP